MLQFITHRTERYDEYTGTEAVLRGGCRWIQLRMKEASDAEAEAMARRLRPLCDRYGATLILDDRAELCVAAEADGVHLGKLDMAPDAARAIVGDRIIGSTANTFEDIQRAARLGADYIGLGPYRFTTTKRNLSPVLGIEGYRDIMARCKAAGIDLPVVAIGGIATADIPAIMAAGVTGIAVSGSLLSADDPAEETARMIEAMRCAAR